MDNAMVLAGQGRAMSRRLLGRLAMLAVGVALVFAVALVFFQQQADAQLINIQQIVCPILINLAGVFGGFFASIFNALLVAFGCGISG